MTIAAATPNAILLATDLSARCDRALSRALQLARQWQARLVVATVLPDMAATGITDAITGSIKGLGLSAVQMLLVVIVFYLILGCFMETLSMMITTIPIVYPIMIHAGYDPIWLGIMIIILVEAALITPPVGLNLFVVQSLRPSGSMNAVIAGSVPFVIAMAVLMLLLAIWPDLALFMPRFFE